MKPVPSQPAVTTPYGKPGSWSGDRHGGVDFGLRDVSGATVVAPWGGTITSRSAAATAERGPERLRTSR